MATDDIPFQTLVNVFEICKNAPKSRAKAALRKFLYTGLDRRRTDLFIVIRLMLPKHDNQRGNYKLKEAKLIDAVLKALSIDQKRGNLAAFVRQWKSESGYRGNKLANVLMQHVYVNNCARGPCDITVGQLNAKLDELVRTDAQEKHRVLLWLCQHCTAQMMYWVTCIILKDLKIGTDLTVLKEFHEGAPHFLNVNRNLKRMCEELHDPSVPAPLMNIQPGNAAYAQMSQQCRDAGTAWAKMKGAPCIAEFKFDGFRVMLHRDDAGTLHYFTRQGHNFRDRNQYHYLDDIVEEQLVSVIPFVLDGELCVWNKARQYFEPFNSMSAVITAIAEHHTPDQELNLGVGDTRLNADPDYEIPKVGDLELVYFAFDVLYCGEEGCVTHKPLSVRHALLQGIMRPGCRTTVPLSNPAMYGRIALVLPNQPCIGGVIASKTCKGPADIEAMMMYTEQQVENAAMVVEGVVVKNLNSQWVPNNRGDSWLKIKPDYVKERDIDAVVVGAFYSSGHRGLDAPNLTQFLLALPDRGPTQEGPVMWLSFCKVGTGLTMEENRNLLQQLRQRASPRPRRKQPQYGKFDAPPNIKVGEGALTKHIPDVWYENPEQSIVLTVIGDVRVMKSDRFATELTIRFPRVKAIRDPDDKVPRHATCLPELQMIVESSRGQLGRMLGRGSSDEGEGTGWRQGRRKKQKPTGLRAGPTLPAHLLPANVTDVPIATHDFQGKKFHFITYEQLDPNNLPADFVAQYGGDLASRVLKNRWYTYQKERWGRVVASLGGTLATIEGASVDYLLSAYKPAIRDAYAFKPQKKQRDVILLDWLAACEAAGHAVPIKRRWYLVASPRTQEMFGHMADVYGNHYLSDDYTPEEYARVFDSVLVRNKTTVPSNTLAMPDTLSQASDTTMPPVALQPHVCLGQCVLLMLTPPGDAYGDCPATHAVIAKRIALQARLAGAHVQDVPNTTTPPTHIVLLPSPLGQPPPTAVQLLSSLQQQHGLTSVRVLKMLLEVHQPVFVSWRWVESVVNAAVLHHDEDQPQPSIQPTPDQFPMTLTSDAGPVHVDSMFTWPWTDLLGEEAMAPASSPHHTTRNAAARTRATPRARGRGGRTKGGGRGRRRIRHENEEEATEARCEKEMLEEQAGESAKGIQMGDPVDIDSQDFAASSGQQHKQESNDVDMVDDEDVQGHTRGATVPYTDVGLGSIGGIYAAALEDLTEQQPSRSEQEGHTDGGAQGNQAAQEAAAPTNKNAGGPSWMDMVLNMPSP